MRLLLSILLCFVSTLAASEPIMTDQLPPELIGTWWATKVSYDGGKTGRFTSSVLSKTSAKALIQGNSKTPLVVKEVMTGVEDEGQATVVIFFTVETYYLVVSNTDTKGIYQLKVHAPAPSGEGVIELKRYYFRVR